MGCCSSRTEDDDGAAPGSVQDPRRGPAAAVDARRQRKVNERTPLLSSAQPAPLGAQSLGSQAALQHAQAEKEALKAVIQKTAENLINVMPADALSSKVAAASSERASQYQRAAAAVHSNSAGSRLLSSGGGAAVKARADVPGVLAAGAISAADRQLITGEARRLAAAVSSATITGVGPIVQALPEL